MLIDSNILIYALNTSSPKQKQAAEYISQQKQLFLTQQNIMETLRIITHTRFPHPFSTSEATALLNDILHNATILSPLPETIYLAQKLIEKYAIRGNEVFDAYFVATALSHQHTTVATDNTKHLGKYSEIAVVNPFA
ncbi:type II toxin-antitoxin system VapC family toxin [Candidatus Woesebacteria bacterium]|nr:type II toxin-antitoxin system VapC family toxin [Candidatus Woesebacteria bacterium]MCD8507314.1 type II toxin-antitoxin system VapC family toxin [Candidatus Woesebacteria bacterium]MCD8526998.1 type II toxin-antitoxin system VapC family toxin [Candidatus Woesebacteria bacterium]MCD8546762.1 type II toxin-antitoxin system VapC family toxin [Candidatus Woesebacteria bacterium]